MRTWQGTVNLDLCASYPPFLPKCSDVLIQMGDGSADDMISEENEIVQEALKRLPPKVVYDRMFRMRRAVQVCCVSYPVDCGADMTANSAPLPILCSRRRSRRSPSRTSAICRRISRRSSVRLLRGKSSIH